MTLIHGQPDDPGPDYSPLTFLSSAMGREVIYLGRVRVGEIAPRTRMLMRGYEVRLSLPDARSSIHASNLNQAKTFAMQEVQDWVSRTPMRLEVRA